MDRRTILSVGLGVGTTFWSGGTAPARPAARVRALTEGLAAGRRLFATGAYDRLHRMLPALQTSAQKAEDSGPVEAGRAAGVWVLASQLAAKQNDLKTAGNYADRAGAAARRSGDPVVLAAAARAAATPLRRTGRATDALRLLRQAHAHLSSLSRPSAPILDATGMVALTTAYTAAQSRQPPSLAVEFAALAEESALRLSRLRAPSDEGLSAQQCRLYRVGIHRELGDVDRALAYAAAQDPAELGTPERRARAATDTARALLAADEVPGAFDQLLRVEQAAPQEARRPSVRALTALTVERRPDLPKLAAFARRNGIR